MELPAGVTPPVSLPSLEVFATGRAKLLLLWAPENRLLILARNVVLSYIHAALELHLQSAIKHFDKQAVLPRGV